MLVSFLNGELQDTAYLTPPDTCKSVLHPDHILLTADELDRLVERGAARTGVTHRGVLVSNRHAAEEDEPVRG
jgi:hypothetical protein